MNYLKIALRAQARHKWFALVNMAGLSIGIISATVIFLYVSGHLSTDSFHHESKQIHRVVLNIETPSGEVEYDESSALPMGKALADDYSQIATTAYCMRFYVTPTISITNATNVTRFKEEKVTAYADNNFINLFEHNFLYGDKSTALKEPRAVVLSERQALKYFGTRAIIGKIININNSLDLTVTGVYANQEKPSDLNFEVMVSLPTLKILNPKYQEHNFSWIGSNNWTFIKLQPNEAASELEAVLPGFVQKHLGPNFKHWHLHLQPLSSMHFDTKYDGSITTRVLWILSAVAIGLIIIVCINYVNLSIAQADNRSKEIGVRKYLGANRIQLFRQFIVETGAMVLLSCLLSLLAIYAALPMINVWLGLSLSLLQFNSVSHITYGIVFVLSLTALAGYYPAITLSGFNPIKAISGNGIALKSNQAFRKGLIAFQYAIALIFMISTLVMIRQLDYFLNKDSGFEGEEIVTVNLPRLNYSSLRAFRNEVLSIPGVQAVTMQHESPMAAAIDGGFIKYDSRTAFEGFIVRDRWGDEDFIRTYGLEFVAGRNIVMHDSATEVIVNETLLRKLGINDPQSILGKSISFDNASVTGSVVGVVKDFHNRSLQNQIEPLAIYPVPTFFNQLGVRIASSKDKDVLNDVGKKWAGTFPEEVFEYSFLDEKLARMYEVEHVTGNLMQGFAVVSVLICVMGVLGLSMFALQRRRKEIGIRKVLGATVADIVVLFCKQYVLLLATGFFIAIPLAFMFTRHWLEGFAYHITLNWVIFVMPAICMMVLTFLVVGAQSMRSALTNPSESLKQE